MDVDIDCTTSKGEEGQGKLILLILVGAPGSGKSTFCESVIKSSPRSWVRICQDTIGNGKSGTKSQCLSSAATSFKDGKSVIIDRCNLDKEQRVDFVKLGNAQLEIHAVVLDLPAKLCISRCVKRTGHEGNLQGGRAAAVVNRMLQKKELPKIGEGFMRITICYTETDVADALNKYSALGPLDTLPSGCFGLKNSNTKVQLGIAKFFKKVEPPIYATSNTNSSQDSAFAKICMEKNSEESKTFSQSAGHADKVVKDDKALRLGSHIPTLAFPSISTADFQFNLEKASEIIVEKVEEFISKIGNTRLVMVDLSPGSKILSLVSAKAAQKNIDSNKFFTFVGDITRLHSEGGLRCNVIANASNWRLKPGGGGVNAAIYRAAGPSLDSATKDRATSLIPGHSLIVPLHSDSPLRTEEGVTHVIHVVGPNMNPDRPNCLDNDYNEGCKVLCDAYSSLFEGFASIVNNQESLLESNSDLKNKRDDVLEWERNKKCKLPEDEADVSNFRAVKKEPINGKSWGSWALALYHMSMNAEKCKNDVLEISDDIVVLNDLYPKAQKHILVLARSEGLDGLADVRMEHLQLLRKMHDVGIKWADKFLCEDASLVFRLGYHSAPSMRQLHLHVISQDFNSTHLKNKKHWNTFNSAFFRDSLDVIEDVINHGKALRKDDDSILSMELRCNRCRSAHPNIPRLKSHISNCGARFPSTLLQNGRLVLAPSKSFTDS